MSAPTPTATRVMVDGVPHAVCPEPGCGRTIMVRADGRSLYTHNRRPGRQCPMSRAPIMITDASPDGT